MKAKLSATLGVFLSLCLSLIAQTPPSFQADETSSAYTVAGQGPHSRSWVSTNKTGRVTHRIEEVASGLSAWDGESQKWVDANAAFTIVEGPDGGALGAKGQHKVFLTADANSQGATVDLEMPDGSRLKLQTVGIALTTFDNSKSMFIGEIRSSIGQMVDDSTVIYPDCFTPIKASLRIRNTLAGIESDVILQERIDPQDWGFDPAATRLEVWSQALSVPALAKRQETIPDRVAGASDVDEQVSFATMQFGNGTAFRSGAGEQASEGLKTVRVAKEWVTIEDAQMTFLIESIPFGEAKEHLDELPVDQARIKPDKEKIERAFASSPRSKRSRPVSLADASVKPTKPRAVASISKGSHSLAPGYVIDYQILNTTLTNFVFSANNTYYVPGTVVCGGALTTFEAGSVIKFAPTNTAKLTINTPITWTTNAYMPVVMTARDDNSVGETVSTNALSGNYATIALEITLTNTPVNIQGLRISYAAKAIKLPTGLGNVISHAQIINCPIGFDLSSSELSLRNVLLNNVSNIFTGATSTGRCEHLTIDTATWMNFGSACSQLYLTNSLLYGVTNQGSWTSVSSYVTNSSPFQTVLAGAHYLANNTYRNLGNANINAQLASDLKTRTTYPPSIYSPSWIYVPTVFYPQIPRDTNQPDIGFHYETVDYLVSAAVPTNTTLTILPGTVLAFKPSPQGYALSAAANGLIVAEGTASNPIHFTSFESVQEQRYVLATNDNTQAHFLPLFLPDGGDPEVRLRFVEWGSACPRGNWITAFWYNMAKPIQVKDSIFHSGITWIDQADLWATNCLFDQNLLVLGTYVSLTNVVQNCSFFKSTVDVMEIGDLTKAKFSDNLFDQTEILYKDSNYPSLYNAYNYASTYYATNNPRLNTNATSDVVLTNVMTYAKSSFGPFYQGVTNLVNRGSTTANTVGLYHFTVSSSQVKETNGVVDMGFHYVATVGGVPADTDGEGLADYLEDRNGSGITADSGETDWNLTDSDYDGRSDFQEVGDGTVGTDASSVLPVRLGYWKFDTSSYLGDAGQTPIVANYLNNPSSFNGKAVELTGINASALQYKDVEASGFANFNRQSGTVRFWFKPNWTSSTGPGFSTTAKPTLFSAGTSSASKTNWWGLYANTNGTSLTFASEAGGSVVTHWTTSISWTSGTWYQLVLTYSPSGSILYINGQQVATSGTAPLVPAAALRAGVGFNVGSVLGGSNLANGQFDELETFDYAADAPQVLGEYPFAFTVTIGSLTNNQTVGPGPINVPLSVLVTNTLSSISKVELFTGTNTNSFATLTTTNSPNTYNYTWTNKAPGAYAIWAKATASNAMTNNSGIRLFRVLPNNSFPTVSITSPANGTVINPGSTFTIKATASDSGGSITNVAFYRGTNLLGNDPYSPYEINCSGWDPGSYVITAKATDNTGLITGSTPVGIVISPWQPRALIGRWDAELPRIFPGGFYADRVSTRALMVDSTNNVYAAMRDECSTCAPPLLSSYGTSCNWISAGCNPSSAAPTAFAFVPQGILMGGAGVGCSLSGTTSLMLWNGSTWTSWDSSFSYSPGGRDGCIEAVNVIKGDIYVGGTFTDMSGSAQYIARRTGSTWAAVGNGLNGAVRAIANIGDTLYVGGAFTSAGGDTNIHNLAKLVNGTWMAVGGGVSGGSSGWTVVDTLLVSGSDLYVGGGFTQAGTDTNITCFAKWDGFRWTGFAKSFTYVDTSSGTPVNLSAEVRTVSIRGKEIYVGGNFTDVTSDEGQIRMNGIARAYWSEDRQKWLWSPLDGGVSYSFGSISASTGVFTSVIKEGPTADTYDLYIGGRYENAGPYASPSVSRWMVGTASCSDPTGLTVQMNAPVNGDTGNAATSLSLQATSTVVSGTTPAVSFIIDGDLSTAIAGTRSGTTYSATWTTTAGVHQIRAIASSTTHTNLTAPVTISITNSSSTIIARPDVYTFANDGLPHVLPIMANDTVGTTMAWIGQWSFFFGRQTLGAAGSGYKGTNAVYTPFPDRWGSETFVYSITNLSGDAAASGVTVNLKARPRVNLTKPADDLRTNAPQILTVSGTATDPDGSITSVQLYVNGVTNGSPLTSFTNSVFGRSWTNTQPGWYTFTAVATDNEGYTNTSYPITIALTNSMGNTLPVAKITNVFNTITAKLGLQNESYPIIRDGRLQLKGLAYDPDGNDAVSYRIALYLPDNPVDPVANLTPGTLDADGYHTGGDVYGDLGLIDFSGVLNGIYDLTLFVRGGGDEVQDNVRLSLQSDLKLGQLKFSEQDLVIPVSGLPLTIVRSYDSSNTRKGDFGYGWTMAINSLDASLDEERIDVQAQMQLDSSDADISLPNVNLRDNGSRNVTLTLPDGKRTTFVFTPRMSATGPFAYAEWVPGPGVTANLSMWTPYGNNTINAVANGLKVPVWTAGFPQTPFDMYDIPGFDLRLSDGTVFELRREGGATYYVDVDLTGNYIPITPYPGSLTVRTIRQISGDSVEISPNQIVHRGKTNNVTRSVLIERDADHDNRITAVRDPMTASSPYAAVRYLYNDETGNLTQVLKLVDRSSGQYATNSYHYDEPRYRHYITSMEDARGVPVAQTQYDTSGRLYLTIDAKGNYTQFTYTNNWVITRDRRGNYTTNVYDTTGNVTEIRDAFGSTNRMSYDVNGFLASRTDPLGNTTTLVNDTNGWVQSSTLPYPYYTTLYTYNNVGQVTSVQDPRGNLSTNYYTTNGYLLSTVTALSTNSFTYDTSGRITSSVDPLGNFMTNLYDSYNNLTNVRAFASSGTVLNTNTFTYDANGTQLSRIAGRTPASGTTILETNSVVYDAQNRVVQTIGPDGKTNSVVFNEIGQPLITFDKLGRGTTNFYDELGSLTNVTYADGSFERYQYDEENRRTNSVDRLGNPTASVYDALGRLSQSIASNNTTNRSVYDAAGRLSQSVDARNTTNAFAYDPSGRRIAVTNAWGVSGLQMVTTNGYDGVGNLTLTKDNMGRSTTYQYDALNRRTNTTLPDSTTLKTQLDALGRTIVEIDQAGKSNSFGYDSLGRLSSVTNALGKVTQYQYDEVGNQTQQIDALNRTTKYEYDSLGRRTKRILPGLNGGGSPPAETLAYDALGNLLSKIDFKGTVITNQYDVMNRLWKKWNASTGLLTNTYDLAGKLITRLDESGTSSWVYDTLGRVATNTTPAGTLKYAYDENGSLTNMVSTTSSGVSVGYQYDALNRLTNVIDSRLTGTKNTAYTYDGVGNLQTLKYPNALTNLYQYDSLNRLTALTWKVGGTTKADFTYTLGTAGNRTNLSSTVNGASRGYSWSYDATYRLTNETITGTAPTGSITYSYDAVGNRLSRVSTVTGLSSTSNNFDGNDWLDNDSTASNTNLWFDANGNQTNSPSVYQYDWANRLVNYSSGTATYVYDGSGTRVKKAVSGTTTLYLVSQVNPSGYAQVVEEFSISGGTTNLTTYTYGLDLISQRTSGVATNFYGYDGLGSVTFLTDGSAGWVNTYAYEAYGNVIASSGTAANSYLFAGEQRDSTLGQYYLRAPRYYDPATGRFTSSDTFEGSQNEPKSLHKLSYCSGDPVNNIDPTGNFTVADVGSAMLIGSALGAATGAAYGGILNGARGALEYGLAGAVIGPIATAGIMVGGSVAAGILGVSEGTGIFLAGSAVNGIGIGFGVSDLINAETPRQRAAAVFSLGMGILGQGMGTRGYLGIRAGRGTFQSMNPNTTAEEIAAGKLAADYFKADIVAQTPEGPKGAGTADYKIVFQGKTLELKNFTETAKFDRIVEKTAGAQSDNVMIIVKPGQISQAELSKLSGRIFSPKSGTHKQSITVVEDSVSGYQIIYHDVRR